MSIDSAKSKVSEKEIVDALADHAQQIAQNVLSRSASGKDLEEDVRVRGITQDTDILSGLISIQWDLIVLTFAIVSRDIKIPVYDLNY